MESFYREHRQRTLNVIPTFCSLMRSAYRKVLRVWSADDAPGETVAIMVVLAKTEVKQSFRMRVSSEARYGTCLLLPLLLLSRAHTHSFKARSDVLISALSVRRWVLCDFVSFPRSLPARSTGESFPLSLPVALSRRIIQSRDHSS